jgi:serpin B
MKKISTTLMLATAALVATLVVSCNKANHDDKNPTPPVKPAEPIKLDSRGAAKVAADNDFAFRFFRETLATVPTQADAENALVSPLSLTIALGMLYNGTSPEAGDELATTLGVGDFTKEQTNAHYKTLVDALLAADPQTALAIANSIWTRNTYPVKTTFYDINRKWYNAVAQSRDFNLKATLDEINKWGADNTNGKIPTILDAIPEDAVLYLINAVYFKSQWMDAFDKNDTRNEPFTLTGGTKTEVSMMNQQTQLPYYSDDKIECVDLPYGNGAFSMMVMMPAADGSLDDLIADLDADTYNKAVNGLIPAKVDLKLPRWKQQCDFRLNDAMKNLGTKQIFGPGSLSGIADDSSLAVSEIRQKTFVEVNEEGTEAAAVTVVGVFVTSVGPGEMEPIEFHADRPFVYLIRERSTGAILFLGRVDDPRFS